MDVCQQRWRAIITLVWIAAENKYHQPLYAVAPPPAPPRVQPLSRSRRYIGQSADSGLSRDPYYTVRVHTCNHSRIQEATKGHAPPPSFLGLGLYHTGCFKKRPPKKNFLEYFHFGYVFLHEILQFVDNSYPHIYVNFCRFILIFHRVALIFPRVPIVFSFHTVKFRVGLFTHADASWARTWREGHCFQSPWQRVEVEHK